MLKILQVTDTHLALPGELVFGIDPQQRLAAAIDDINRNNADADFCVFTGDLVDNSDYRTYESLFQTISRIAVPYRIVPGNHDDRGLLRRVFPDIAVDGHGFIQSTLETRVGQLVFLDTVDEGVHSGIYCRDRSAWLENVLDSSEDRPVYIFMHHPPFHIGLKHLDSYSMVQGDRFGDLLCLYSNIRHIFFGHVHRPVTGSWRRIPFSALRGTNHQCFLDLKGGDLNICNLEPPSYAVILLDDERTLVHFHDFLDSSPRYAYDPDGHKIIQI